LRLIPALFLAAFLAVFSVGHEFLSKMGCLGGREMVLRRVFVVLLILGAALAIFLMAQYADTALYFIQKCLATTLVHYVL
jgi:hypothetical protein